MEIAIWVWGICAIINVLTLLHECICVDKRIVVIDLFVILIAILFAPILIIFVAKDYIHINADTVLIDFSKKEKKDDAT